MITRNRIFGSQQGQTLLIIVLVMVVVLTAGLSIVSRTLTNLRTTTEQANSQKALSAAEAGIEQSLKNYSIGINANVGGSFGSNTTYTTTLTTVDASAPFLLNGGSILSKDDGAYVWITPYIDNFNTPWTGNLTLYWGSSSETCDQNPDVNTAAALEIVVISGTKASPTEKKYAVDPCSSRISANNFSASTDTPFTISDKQFAHQYTIPSPGVVNGLLVRVLPLYANAFVGAKGAPGTCSGGLLCPPLPSQGSIVTSSGTSDTTKRRLEVFQGYPEIPVELFPYGLFQPK